jgi:hypothetical protein
LGYQNENKSQVGPGTYELKIINKKLPLRFLKEKKFKFFETKIQSENTNEIKEY